MRKQATVRCLAGTHVKKGPAPSGPPQHPSNTPPARRKTSTSAPRANCGSLVSNFVDTTTVRDSVGSACAMRRSRSTSHAAAQGGVSKAMRGAPAPGLRQTGARPPLA
eukprot:356876-Chlamydomonas_euryale.AAC.1